MNVSVSALQLLHPHPVCRLHEPGPTVDGGSAAVRTNYSQVCTTAKEKSETSKCTSTVILMAPKS